MFYAKSTSGFYDAEIHGDNIPNDAVEITPEQHAALLNGQSNGKQIVGDENGQPIYREDGKVMKSALYFKPNIKAIIEG
jgi:hypothetical protein